MSVSAIHPDNPLRHGVPWRLQIAAWILGVAACVLGMLDLVAEWKPDMATIQFLVLAIAPILGMMGRRTKNNIAAPPGPSDQRVTDWCLCLMVGAVVR